jgi:hypothetical protein
MAQLDVNYGGGDMDCADHIAMMALYLAKASSSYIHARRLRVVDRRRTQNRRAEKSALTNP